MPQSDFRLGELLSALSLVTDLGEGLPPETAVRTCVVATSLARDIDMSEREVTATYYVSLLKHVGCTSYAHERAALAGGDDMRLVSVVQGRDMTNPRDVLGAVLAMGKGLPPLRAAGIVARLGVQANRLVQEATQAFCEVGVQVGRRLQLGSDVEEALYASFEAWNGKGFPTGLAGEEIPRPIRCEHVAELATYVDRVAGPDAAVEAVRRQRSRWLDPQISDVFLRMGRSMLEDLASVDPLDRAIQLESEPVMLTDASLERVAKAFADLVDLKSPVLHGHSSGVAQLASSAAGELRLSATQVRDVRLAGLLHDVGRLGVRNGVWEKRGALTAAEWDQVRLHPYHTERILLHSRLLTPVARIASLHHERQDGSGYHRQLAGATVSMAGRVLAAADAFQAMTSDRPQRPALTLEAAGEALVHEATGGRLDPDAVDAVLVAAGRVRPPRRAVSGLLSEREVEVLLLIIKGLRTREVAQRLFISPKTADHHIQHIYTKIGVSSRAAAAMWAMEHGFV